MAWQPFDADEWMKDLTREELMKEINEQTRRQIKDREEEYDTWSKSAHMAWDTVRFYNKLINKINKVADKNMSADKKIEKIKKLVERVCGSK